MTRDEFWDVIDRAREAAERDLAGKLEESREVWGPTCLLTAEHVRENLERGGADRVLDFLAHQDALMAESYRWSLWGAAYLINGGCSDDGFEYFRGWVIAQGRAPFERALEDPDSLAELWDGDDDALECEDMLSVASYAYEALTGGYPEARSLAYPSLGERWNFDDDAEMQRRYPKLWKKSGRAP